MKKALSYIILAVVVAVVTILVCYFIFQNKTVQNKTVQNISSSAASDSIQMDGDSVVDPFDVPSEASSGDDEYVDIFDITQETKFKVKGRGGLTTYTLYKDGTCSVTFEKYTMQVDTKWSKLVGSFHDQEIEAIIVPMYNSYYVCFTSDQTVRDISIKSVNTEDDLFRIIGKSYNSRIKPGNFEIER